MSKYHINKQGKVAECKATVKPCPLGSDNEHFNSMEKAQKYADEKNKNECGVLANQKQKNSSREILAYKNDGVNGFIQIYDIDYESNTITYGWDKNNGVYVDELRVRGDGDYFLDEYSNKHRIDDFTDLTIEYASVDDVDKGYECDVDENSPLWLE